MMSEESIIRAYQKILPSFEFSEPESFPEGFAIKRFLKKMEVPDKKLASARRAACWDNWISFDAGLPSDLVLPRSTWYKARSIIHKVCEQFRMADVDFSNGSEFSPTRGFQSIQQKLSHSRWECTPSNIDLFADACYSNPALKKAVRERFKNLLAKHNTSLPTANRLMWKGLSSMDSRSRTRAMWRAKVQMVTRAVQGSRFSTVRKNNEKDRPINIEAFCNMITQRRIGLGLKELILSFFGVDLEHGQDVHALMISSPLVATIDLRNASDSVTVALVKFLFPTWFVRLLEQSRSPMVLGPDGSYHWTRKISAMGNGFTFELMTLILLALTRCHDPDSLVYGDDIIVRNEVASQVIVDLENVGFVVNTDKSFISSDFRESCGANFHDDHGYLDSFDFEYPESIGDCVMIHNKAMVLSVHFESFRRLYQTLTRVVTDTALLGQWVPPGRNPWDVPDWELPPYFARNRVRHLDGHCVSRSIASKARELFDGYGLSEEPRFFWGFSFEEELATKTLKHLSSRQWAKYYMYLHSGRRAKDVLVGRGRWRRILFISHSTFSTRWKSVRGAVPSALDALPVV